MGLLARRRPYDRRRNLERAALAARGRSKRKRRRAIALYREVLERDPSATDVHRKLAPLLARNGEGEAAARSYHTAADAYVKRGFVEQAIGVYREALVQLPRQVRFWSELAKLELERGRTADALKVLLEGRRVFRRRRDRAHAIALLLAARRVAPSHLDTTLDLALQLARAGARDRALRVLHRFPVAGPSALRRLCARELRVAPGLRAAARWLRALLLRR